MTTKTIEKTGTKPTPIKPQVWANVWYVHPSNKVRPGLSLVGPDEWMDEFRHPTEEIAAEEARKIEQAGLSCCPGCALSILFGYIKYLRADRLE